MIKFRTATLSDVEQIAQLVNSAFRGDSSRVGWTTEADILDGQRTDREKLSELILENNSQIEIALGDKNIIACVHLRKEEPDTLYFGMFTVKPVLQDKGIGKLLLNQVNELAQKYNFKYIRISVIHTRLELISYYERRGFVKTGSWEPFPEDDPLFGEPKILGLRLIEMRKDLKKIK